MGQGDPGGQHQGRVGRPLAGTFHKLRSANGGFLGFIMSAVAASNSETKSFARFRSR